MEKQRHTLKLQSGDEMPIIGSGTWKLEVKRCSQIVYEAIKTGYRLIDCAYEYENEKQIGKGIKKALDEGIVKREQLFVASKLWNSYHRQEHVQEGFMKSLQLLGLQYLDLFLIHHPISLKYSNKYPADWIHDRNAQNPRMIEDQAPIIGTWRGMERLVNKGLIKNIGVSNFNVSLLRDLFNSSTIKPSVLQIELHPHLTQKRLTKFCRQKNIQITSYSSLGPSSYPDQKVQLLVDNKVIKKIAQKHKKSTGQIIFRWVIQQQIAIIPKTNSMDRLRQNVDVFGWKLSKEDMEEIDGLNQNRRYNDPAIFCESAFGCFYPVFD